MNGSVSPDTLFNVYIGGAFHAEPCTARISCCIQMLGDEQLLQPPLPLKGCLHVRS